jgi:hypothetical protein
MEREKLIRILPDGRKKKMGRSVGGEHKHTEKCCCQRKMKVIYPAKLSLATNLELEIDSDANPWKRSMLI